MDTHTSTALFPFAQANTYRERLSIKGLWGEGRGGICSRQSQCQQGDGQAPLLTSSSLRPALVFWGQAAKAGVWGRTPGRQDAIMNVMFLGTEKPVSVAAATMSCVYCRLCRHLAERRASARTPGCGLGSGRHLLVVRRALS